MLTKNFFSRICVVIGIQTCPFCHSDDLRIDDPVPGPHQGASPPQAQAPAAPGLAPRPPQPPKRASAAARAPSRKSSTSSLPDIQSGPALAAPAKPAAPSEPAAPKALPPKSNGAAPKKVAQDGPAAGLTGPVQGIHTLDAVALAPTVADSEPGEGSPSLPASKEPPQPKAAVVPEPEPVPASTTAGTIPKTRAEEPGAESQALTLPSAAAALPQPEPEAIPAAADASAERIARLSRLVEGLRRKADRLQKENEQLEEMLAAADAAHRGGSSEISRLEDALAKEQAARTSAEASLGAALAAKESEAESLKEQLSAATARASSLAEALAAREAEKAMSEAERSASESHLIATLRKEVEAAEALLEEERKAHAATRRAGAAREQELDTSMAGAAASLAAMQRSVEERTQRAAVAEERAAHLEAEVEALGRRVQVAEAKVEAPAGGAAEPSVAEQRVEELEAALREARHAASAAEAAAATSAEDVVRLRSEVDTLRRQLADARSGDAVELRRRLQEVTEALYQKQAQLERATADRAATQLQLERQMSTTQADHVRRRTAAVDRVFSGVDDSYGIVPMDSLGDAYARLANAPGHLGRAVKAGAGLLDSTASQAVRILRQYPLGRLLVFFYIVAMHLFIYMLLHRLQHRAFLALAATEGGAGDALHSG